METIQNDRLLNTGEVAERLSVSKVWLYELISRGEIRSVKLGRRRLIRESDLSAYIASLEG